MPNYTQQEYESLMKEWSKFTAQPYTDLETFKKDFQSGLTDVTGAARIGFGPAQNALNSEFALQYIPVGRVATIEGQNYLKNTDKNFTPISDASQYGTPIQVGGNWQQFLKRGYSNISQAGLNDTTTPRIYFDAQGKPVSQPTAPTAPTGSIPFTSADKFNPNTGQPNPNYNPTGATGATGTTTGTFKSGDTVSQVVQSLGITPTEFLKYNPQYAAKGTLVNGKNLDWQGLTGSIQPGQTYVIPGKTAPITAPIGTGVPTSGTTAPTLPTPTSTDTTNSYFGSLSQQVTSAQQALTIERDKQLATIQADKTAAQTELDSIRSQQQTAITDMGTASIEEKQMILDRLKIEEARFNENYTAVQGLTTQLMDLMTEGNNLIAMVSGKTGLQGIRNPRINQAIQAVTAATGVIQAGISAYNGQMSQAQSQLINATNVITSAYTDQLDYYKTLYNFYESKASDTNAKLIVLTKNERDFLDAKIAELENNVKRAQDNSDYIQKLMISPTTALFMAQAGITLNDTPDQVNYKMALQTQRQKIIDTTNEYVKAGYTPVAMAGAGTETIQSGGQNLYFKPPLKTTEVSAGATLYDQYGNIIATAPKATDTKITDVELKQLINKQIAAPEFQALSDADKALYIQSQGGTPYDFGY